MAKSLLRVENVVKRFGGLIAVDNVSFQVGRGEFIGLIGPNGAGKTTLFNVVSGVYKPEAGHIYFKDRDITGLQSHKITRLGIARTFQIPKPFKEMTVLENAMVGALFGRRAGKIDVSEAKEIALNSIELVGLRDKADHLASNLNLHDKKMLELARALSAEPELLLLDEALAGLNPREVEESLQVIERVWRERDLTIIMVEHVMHAVMNIAQKIIVLHYGKKIAEGRPEEVAKMSEVITAYLGDPELALKFVRRREE